MRTDDFDFDLPEDLIALRPVTPRRASKMLVSNGSDFLDGGVQNLPDYLNENDLLVFNDTKVIPARLSGQRIRPATEKMESTSVNAESTLIQREAPDQWWSLSKPGRRLKVGDTITFNTELSAQILDKKDGGMTLLRFNKSGADLDVAVVNSGVLPLPPYIAGKRATDDQDTTDYQTVFAKQLGAVAAPTASLHFDQILLDAITDKGIKSTYLTLHVGAGTFLPVKTDNTDDHHMHSEWGQITAETAAMVNETKAKGGRIIAVGTTALRLLESAGNDDGTLNSWTGDTNIFISPGYKFKIIDGLMTNFHLPRSTLFMLVSAFMGLNHMQALYAHAITNKYRFYSYGDSSLLLNNPSASI